MTQWTPTKFERVELVDANQLDLFTNAPAVIESSDHTLTIQERFEAFHAANPWLEEGLVRLARDLHAAGHQRIGIGTLWETVRYSGLRVSGPDGGFKLNDHFRSRYARLLVSKYPDIAGMFELRELRAS